MLNNLLQMLLKLPISSPHNSSETVENEAEKTRFDGEILKER